MSDQKPEQFPRGTELPVQSPLFWVEQKDRYLRQLLIRDIEGQTKRRLLVYFANRYENAQIDSGDCAFMNELLGDVAKDEPLDLMLETIGGVTDATEGLITLIQNRVSDLRVIVTNVAKSNGTLLALAANRIVMGASSELGPIEPLVNGIPCTILSHEEIKKSNFPLHMFGVHALQQSKSLAKKLLENGMLKGKPDDIEKTVLALASRESYFSHGSVIDHREAATLGLNVQYLPPGDPTWERLWLLHCMYEHDCKRNRFLKVFEGRRLSTAVAMPPAPPPSPKSV